MYYLGFDGGGTKSRLMAVDESNNILGRHEGRSTNLSSNSAEDVMSNLKKLVDMFLKNSGEGYSNCGGLCIGSAGIDTEESAVHMKKILRNIGFKCPIRVVNDAEIILWAQIKSEAGIVVISGTGSVAYGKDNAGHVARCGGWGHLLDDGGSGYWIGREIVRRALMAFDGRGKATVLVEMLKKQLNVSDISGVVSFIYRDGFNKSDIAALSVLAEKGMTIGDEVCRDILSEATDSLFIMADALTKRLNLSDTEFKIILSGGSILNNKQMKKNLIKKINEAYKSVIIKEPDQDPVMGAVYLAKFEEEQK